MLGNCYSRGMLINGTVISAGKYLAETVRVESPQKYAIGTAKYVKNMPLINK